MHEYSKAARKYLKECTRNEFETAIFNSKLTPYQESIIRMHILEDRPVCYIALKLNCSDASVRRALAAVYLRVSKAIFERSNVTIPDII